MHAKAQGKLLLRSALLPVTVSADFGHFWLIAFLRGEPVPAEHHVFIPPSLLFTAPPCQLSSQDITWPEHTTTPRPLSPVTAKTVSPAGPPRSAGTQSHGTKVEDRPSHPINQTQKSVTLYFHFSPPHHPSFVLEFQKKHDLFLFHAFRTPGFPELLCSHRTDTRKGQSVEAHAPLGSFVLPWSRVWGLVQKPRG